MKPRAYKFDTRVFSGVAIMRCRDSHYHSDCDVAFSNALNAALDVAETQIVIVDMSVVRLFSSSALCAVRAAHSRAAEGGGRIVAAGGGELVINVLKFAPFITHRDTVAEALSQYSEDAARAFAKAEG